MTPVSAYSTELVQTTSLPKREISYEDTGSQVWKYVLSGASSILLTAHSKHLTTDTRVGIAQPAAACSMHVSRLPTPRT